MGFFSELKAPSVPLLDPKTGETTNKDGEKVEMKPAGRKEDGGGRKEEGYDSAATISADETQEQDKTVQAAAAAAAMAARGGIPPKPFPPVTTQTLVNPQGIPVSKTIYVKDIMNTVIDESLRRPSNQPNQGRTGEISSIKDLLPEPGTFPAHPSFTKGMVLAPAPLGLEVRAVSGAGPSVPATASGGGGVDGALDLTSSKRDTHRVVHPPPHHPAPNEPTFKSNYVEAHRDAPGFGHQPVSRNEKPPEAHGDLKAKTTHKESMFRDNMTLKLYNDRMSIHSPTHLVHPDPRQDLLSHTKSFPQPSSINPHKVQEGSITRGQPIPQLQGSHSSGRYDASQMKAHPTQRGSLTTGTPVYTDRRVPTYNSEPPGRSSQPSLDMHKKQQQPPYSVYPRSASHDSRGSSRSVIESDYKMAQSLPRKDQSEDLRGGFGKTFDHRNREVQIVDSRTDPRFEQRPPFYGSPRVANPYSSIRTDPKADIPPRDPRTEVHDVRSDPRLGLDARGRPPFTAYPTAVRDQGRRRPPRSLAAPRSHPGGPSSVPSPRPGSIISGLPRSSVEIHSVPRQPEVSITKQPVIPSSRPEYPNTNLASFADIALQQPKMRETDHRGAGNSSLTVTRTDVGPGRLTAADLAKSYGKFEADRNQQLNRVAREQQEEQHRLFSKVNQMSDQEKLKLYEAQVKAFGNLKGQNEALTTKSLIEMIVTSQINQSMTGGANVMNPATAAAVASAYGLPPRHPAQMLQINDGKDSPNKPPSRSPSIKSSDLREGGEDRPITLRTSPAGTGTPSLGDHLDSMIKKEVKRTSPYPGPSTQAEAHDYWKRKQYPDPNFMPRPPSQGAQARPPSRGMAPLVSDERQIIRVAQNASPRPDKPPSRSMMDGSSPTNVDPARSTPNYPYQGVDPMARFLAAQRKPHEVDPAAAKSNEAVFDYVKTKIVEAMKNDKTVEPGKAPAPPSSTATSMGPPTKRPLESEPRDSTDGGAAGGSGESPRKRYKPEDHGGGGASNDLPDSPGSGEMVIDESARPDSAHSHKTASPAPNNLAIDPYPGFRGGPLPPQSAASSLPPRSSPSMMPPRTTAASLAPPPPTGPPAGSRYEPLSDDD